MSTVYCPRAAVTEGWLEIDEHYSLELCFSIEKQPETVSPGYPGIRHVAWVLGLTIHLGDLQLMLPEMFTKAIYGLLKTVFKIGGKKSTSTTPRYARCNEENKP